MKIRARALAVASTVGVPLASTSADPACGGEVCSCGAVDVGFLVMTGAAIPLDSRGLPWFGHLDYVDRERVLPDPCATSRPPMG